MVDPAVSLQNWWRVLKSGGHMIIYIPHRDLFEKKKTLPSNWNDDHKQYFLLDKDEAPDTIGAVPLIERTLTDFEIIYAKVCNEGFTITDPLIHSDGEYSIEVVLKKL
jgi:SAM-dependent methyltransferase